MSSLSPAALPDATDRKLLTAPTPRALRLGYAGLIPFVAGAAMSWLVRPDAHPYVIDALVAYAALIVSFLGGIHWGLGMLRAEGGAGRFAWGVLPSLLAWVAVLMPAYAGLVAVGGSLIVCYLVDRRIYPSLGLQAWMTLRFRLTLVASLCCFVAAAGS